jgi:cold shock CspA family protein
MTRGTVISYDTEEEQGYIDPDEGDERIPFDRKSLEDYPAGETPAAGARVSFVVEGGMAGLWAIKVRRLD